MSEEWYGKRYFDTDIGMLVDDEAAVKRSESSDANVVRIGSLLIAPEFNYTNRDFPDAIALKQLETDRWGPERYQNYGVWIKNLVEEVDPTIQPVTHEQIRRMYILGLGPGYKRFMNHIGGISLAEYRLQIGVRIGNAPNRYADWGVRNYVNHAKVLASKLKRKPLAPDYDAESARGDGPSSDIIICSTVRGIDRLNELIWYPNVHEMDEDDCVFWGSRVMKANGGTELTSTMVGILGARNRGPSVRQIYNLFTAWGNFKKRTKEQYELDLSYEQQIHAINLQRSAELIASGDFPEVFNKLPEAVLLKFGGRFALIDYCVPWLPQANKVSHALNTEKSIKTIIKDLRPMYTSGEVEVSAVLLGVFDDIWQLDDGLEHLNITREELAAARKKEAVRKSASRQ